MPTTEKVVLFLGSGFSAELGLPVTSKLQDELLKVSGGQPAEQKREAFISDTISAFWEEVFGWTPSGRTPSLEDHFTEIDLAANSGHYLGRTYGPKKLRALRRMTIHRLFKRLDIQPQATAHVDSLIRKLTTEFNVSIVTTNWDIMAECCLQTVGTSLFYSRRPDPRELPQFPSGIPVWKLHGSGNWGYCDVCRSLITGEINLGKTTV